MNNDITIEKETLREIILGKRTFRKCPACNNAGRQYWDSSGVSVLPYPHESWGDDYDSGPCEDCSGLAYIPNA